MNKYLIILFAIIGVLLFLVFLIFLFNIFRIKSIFKKLDVNLKRRHVLSIKYLDLIYDCFLQDQSALIAINDVNGKLNNKLNIDEYFVLNVRLSEELQRIFDSSLNYPELKQKENFDSIHNELLELSKSIDLTRFEYNKKCKKYNKLIKKFPYKIFGLKEKKLYITKYDRFENNY